MKKGKLVVIEGNDGSGKGTQLNLLLEYLKINNISHSFYDFPQYGKTFFGDFVGEFLNGKFGHVSRINPYLSMFPYAGDRWQVKDKLNKDLDTHNLVLCNRYAPSIAYQLTKIKPQDRISFLNWAEKLEYDIFGIPREDLVIFLYVPFNIAHKLIEKKVKRDYLKDKFRDQNEENIKYLQRVEKMYIWLNKYKKNWALINCVKNNILLSPENIHNNIINILKEKGYLG